MKLSIRVKSYPNLLKKIRGFYGETLRIAQKQGIPPTFQDAKKLSEAHRKILGLMYRLP